MHIHTDGMQPTEAMKAETKRHQAIFLGAVVVLNVAALTWTFWPSSPGTYEDCMVRMAEKAEGNATIFNRLAFSNCYKLSPAYIEQKDKRADELLSK